MQKASADANSDINQMLTFSGKDFKATIIKMVQQSIQCSWNKFGKGENLSKEIEVI